MLRLFALLHVAICSSNVDAICYASHPNCERVGFIGVVVHAAACYWNGELFDDLSGKAWIFKLGANILMEIKCTLTKIFIKKESFEKKNNWIIFFVCSSCKSR